MKYTLAALSLILSSTAAMAQSTPVGLWKTFDESTKAEKSLVRVSEAGGVVTGKVEKVLEAGKQDAKCDKCTDERKDMIIQGMTIIRNVKQNADDKGLWDGGDILDPAKGEVYKVRLKPADGGKKLDVRGYIGAPLLGRTQTWVRVE